MTQLYIGGAAVNGRVIPVEVTAKSLNRHGLIAGATGTGKTVTLQCLAEGLSRLGVPVFLADIKGDLSGLAAPGSASPKLAERLEQLGLAEPSFTPSPVCFWDIEGKNGHPLRTTLSEMGPLLLSNLLELNETQVGILYACFKEADKNGWLMLDVDDLQAMLQHLQANSEQYSLEYGVISAASVGAIKRRLLILQEQGIEQFLGEPAVTLQDLMRCDASGRGFINILDATRLVHSAPRLYATALLWLLSELFEQLPEVGDLDVPRFALFLDEAHLLFKGMPKSLQEKIEQVVRLIRSKGVGVFFITQSPLDLPAPIAAQLGLKIQHALRAFTPKDQKMLDAVAAGFCTNPDFSTRERLPSLSVGEALVSSLDAKGAPTPVLPTLLAPPLSRIGPLTEVERDAIMAQSAFVGRFDQRLNRESACEFLQKRHQVQVAAETPATAPTEEASTRSSAGRPRAARESVGEAFLKSVGRAVGSQLGRQLVRGLLGALLKK